MASRPAPRNFTVLGSHMVTPSLLRLRLGGEGMATFPAGQQGGYIKLMLGEPAGGGKPVVRTYTIRAQGSDFLDVDFALHGIHAAASGPATGWAVAATGGEAISVGGPGPAKPLPAGRDFYLLAGDMTALPAISVNLEALARDARGLAFIEIQQEADRQDINAPEGVEIRWLVNPEPGTQPAMLRDAVAAAGWPEGSVYAWAASEFGAMRALRDYLRGERALTSADLYISSYWKSGLDEDNHKVAKREDAELAGTA